jgi:hypothetical protein
MRIASVALVCLFFAGCGSTVPVPSERPQPSEQPSAAPSTPSPSASVEGFKLALLPPDEESPPAPCADIGTDGGRLQGAEADLHKAWLAIPVVPPRREELVWPAGYRAQFNPDLIIVAADGRIFARAGDRVDGLCVTEAGQRFIPLNYRRSPG